MTGKLGWVIAIEVGIMVSVAAFFLPGGDDLHRFYRPFAGGCLDCGFVPYFARWILYPLALIPARFAWPVLTMVSVAGFIGLCFVTKVNPAVGMLSFPAMGQIWLGQIDIIICAGLVIGLWATNPYVRGAGLVLAMVKPQLAILPVAVLLFHQRREIIKVLAVPFAVMLISFFIYGFTWPIDWAINSLHNLPGHVWRLASQDIWPYGIGLILAVLAAQSGRVRFETALIVSALVNPFFGAYSYIILLLFRAPWWSIPLSYGWLLLYPLYGASAMRFAWILPAGLLVHLLAENRAEIVAKIRGFEHNVYLPVAVK